MEPGRAANSGHPRRAATASSTVQGGRLLPQPVRPRLSVRRRWRRFVPQPRLIRRAFHAPRHATLIQNATHCRQRNGHTDRGAAAARVTSRRRARPTWNFNFVAHLCLLGHVGARWHTAVIIIMMVLLCCFPDFRLWTASAASQSGRRTWTQTDCMRLCYVWVGTVPAHVAASVLLDSTQPKTCRRDAVLCNGHAALSHRRVFPTSALDCLQPV